MNSARVEACFSKSVARIWGEGEKGGWGRGLELGVRKGVYHWGRGESCAEGDGEACRLATGELVGQWLRGSALVMPWARQPNR